MSRPITFIFFHYGQIPLYLSHAIEHVRIFNPDAEIHLITESIKDTSMMDRFGIHKFQMEDFGSEELNAFKKSYRHLSTFNVHYEKFCFERWFVTEMIRKKSPDSIYVLLDSDVAVFSRASDLVPSLPDCAISLCENSPHFTFVKGSVGGFLNFILYYYSDPTKISHLENLRQESQNKGQNYNLSDQAFLALYMKESREMQNYKKDTANGCIDTNIHIPEGFEFNQLRRRPRKKIFWKMENDRVIPYFKNGDLLTRALLLHFQGPGKRVFYRFNGGKFFGSKLGLFVLNQVFQNKIVANFL